jgi:trehalose 6-phosphate phosphatase
VSLAVHHRLVSADALEPTRGDVERMLERAITAGGLDGVIQHGHAVLELRPRGAEKGIALRELVRTRDARPVLMIGDDLTDEPALTLAESIGGIGVLVGSRERVSRASARLDDPSAVVALLERLATLLGSPR